MTIGALKTPVVRFWYKMQSTLPIITAAFVCLSA
jgi:hypothetical protein